MSPEFSRLINPYINKVLTLVEKLERGINVDLDMEKRILVKELEEAEESIPEKKISKQHFQLAKRALVYWTDEIIIRIDRRFSNISLEWDIYRESLRGENFYIYGVRDVVGSNNDVIETWFICLALGFMGDIEAGFLRLNRPLPGNVTDNEQARKLWANELLSLLRTPSITEPKPQKLSGELSNLDGYQLFPMSLGLLFFSILLCLGLYYILEHYIKVPPEPDEFDEEVHLLIPSTPHILPQKITLNSPALLHPHAHILHVSHSC